MLGGRSCGEGDVARRSQGGKIFAGEKTRTVAQRQPDLGKKNCLRKEEEREKKHNLASNGWINRRPVTRFAEKAERGDKEEVLLKKKGRKGVWRGEKKKLSKWERNRMRREQEQKKRFLRWGAMVCPNLERGGGLEGVRESPKNVQPALRNPRRKGRKRGGKRNETFIGCRDFLFSRERRQRGTEGFTRKGNCSF